MVVHRLRKRHGSERVLPHFLVIGAQKCGTTSLFNYLSSHPQIARPIKKEIHFFDAGNCEEDDVYVSGGEAWYRTHFPRSCRLHERLTFEASPSYLYVPIAAQRIREALPDVKLIALLRDPVERAISHYRHNRGKGREPLGFLEAILQETGRLEGSGLRSRRMYSYRDRGLYAEQLRRFQAYRHAGRLLVVNSQDLFQRPLEVFQRVCRFLEIEPGCPLSAFKARNVSRAPAVIEPEALVHLREFFREPNRQLWNWLGEEFEWS
jgi:hypothetical protein